MAFIYDADFTVHSVIDNLDDGGLPTGEPEINIVAASGFLKLSRTEDGEIFNIMYSESDEDGARTVTDITVEGGKVLLSRHGGVDYTISFSEGEEYEGIYSVPPYSFDMKVFTKRVRSSLSREGGELQMIYSMEVGGAEKSCRMKISVKTKKKS